MQPPHSIVRGTSRAWDAQGKTSLETYAARPRARVGHLAVCAVVRSDMRYPWSREHWVITGIVLSFGIEYRTSTVP